MIGKILLDKFGEKVLGQKKEKHFEIIPKVTWSEIKDLQKEIKKCNTTVEVKAVVDKNGWQNVKDLQSYLDEMYNKGEVDKIDKDEINKLITAQNNTDIAKQAKGYSGVNTAIKEYNKLSDQASRTQLADEIAKENTSLGKYMTNLNGATAGMGGYAKALVTSTVKTAALQVATAALNGLISFGVTLAIEALVSSIVKGYQKIGKLRDLAKNVVDDYKNLQSTFNENSSTISKLQTRYAELSKGVDSFGDIIDLTSEEYDEYKDIMSQVSSLMPELDMRYNAQGEAVGFLTGKIKDLNAEYEKYRQQQVQELFGKRDENGNNLYDSMEVYELSHAQNPNAFTTVIARNAQNGENFLDEIQTEGFFKALKHNIENSASTPFIVFEQYKQELTGTLNDQIKELENDLESGKYQGTSKVEAETRLQELKAKLEQDMDTWRTYASGTATLNSAFKGLESEQQASVSNFLNNMSAEFIEGNGLDSQQNMYQFVNTFINGLKDKKSDISEAFNSLLEFNVDDPELNPQEIQSALDSIIRQLLQALKDAGYNVDTSEEGIARFKISYGLKFVDDNAEDYENKLKGFYKQKPESVLTSPDNIKEDMDKWKELEEQRKKEVEAWADENKVTTDELSQLKKQGYDSSNSIDTLTEALKQNREEQERNSIAELRESGIKFNKNNWEDIEKLPDNDENKNLKEAQTALQELAETGKLTVDTFNETPNSDVLLSYFGLTADEAEKAVEKINEFVSSADQLSSMKTGISGISSILSEKKENLKNKKTRDTGIGADTLAGLPEDVKENAKEYEHFVETLGNGNSTMEECRQAANRLATAYVNSSNFLAKLNSTNKDYYISVLEEMGVENADAVVTETLKQKNAELAAEKQWAKQSSEELAGATGQEIVKLTQEKGWSEEAANALYRLALQKQIANGIHLNTKDDIESLLALVEGLGGATDAITAWKNYNGSGGTGTARRLSEAAKKQVKDALKKSKTKVSVNPSPVTSGSGDKSSKNNSNKPTGTVNKSTKEEINWMERTFDVISQKIDLLKSKFENLFDIDLKTNNINQQVNQVNKDLNTTSKAIELYTKKYKALGKKKVKVTVGSKTVKGKKGKKTKKPKTKKMSIKKYLKKAKNGGNSIQKVYGEQADLISQYEKYYDLVTEMRKKQQEDIASLYDLEMQKISAVTDYYDTYIGRLEAAKSIITSTIDLQSKISGALGGAETGTKSQYISQLNKQAEITQKQKEQYNKTVNARNKGAKQLEDSNTKDRKKLVKSLNKQVKKKKITKKEKQQRLDDFDNAFKDTKKKYDYESATEVDNAKAAWIDSIGEMLDAAQSLENISLEEFAIQSEKIEKEISALNSALGRTSEASLSSMKGVDAYNKALEAENQKRYDAYQAAKSTLAAATSHKNAYAKELASLGVNASTIKTAENLEGLSTKQQQVAVKYLASMDAIHEATDNLSDASNEYLDTISENSQNMLDNIKSYFDKIDEDIQHKMDVSDAKLKSANNQGLREKYITDSYQGKLDQTENHENERKTNLDGLWDDILQLNSAALNPTLKPVLDKIGFFLQGNSIKPHILTADDQKVLQEYGGTLPKWFSEAIINSSKRLETDKTLEQQKELDDASAAYWKHEWYQQIFDSRNEQKTRDWENAANGQAAIEKIEDVISNLEAGGRRVDADKYQEESKAYHVSAALAKQYGDELWEYIRSRTDKNSADYDETFEGSDTYFNMVETAKAWYDKQTEAEINSIEMRHKAWQTRIEDFNRGWDDIINGIEHTINYMDQNISILETKGHYITSQFYDNMADVYDTQLELEKEHNKQLQDKIRESVNSGDLQQYSDEWYDLMEQLYSSDESIMNLTQSCAEMAKSAREANRELRDLRISAIDNLLGEAEFFQNLSSREKQFDKDSGAITKHGVANFALGFAQIDDEEAKIKEYQESLATLEEQYTNSEIGAKEYHENLEQYNESIQNSITNIYSLKDALKSLAEEGLNAQLDALKELCDKYKDTLNEAKNLRDYQNTIEEQTKAKESLEKQLAVVQQMNTEEGRSKTQSLLVQLDEANKALEETEYDKYISDQENLIDEFQTDFEDFITEQLEYTDALLENIRDAINGEGKDSIISTINGYTIPFAKSMSKWLEKQIGKDGTDTAIGAANQKNEEYNQTPPVVIEQPNHDDLIYFKGSNSTETSRTPEEKTQSGASNYPGKIAGEMYARSIATTEDGSKKAQTGTYTKGISTTSASREKPQTVSYNNDSQTQSNKSKNHSDDIISKQNAKNDLIDFMKSVGKNRKPDDYSYNECRDKKFLRELNQILFDLTHRTIDPKTQYKPIVKQLKEIIPSHAPVTADGDDKKTWDKLVTHLISNAGFSHGGIVDAVRKNGDDGLATLKVGEAVLTPVEFNNLQKLTDSLGDLNFVMDSLHQLSDPPQSISTVNANKTIEIGSVNWNVSGTGIVDGDTFAKRMSNDSKFHKFMGDYVTDYFTGDSKSRRY